MARSVQVHVHPRPEPAPIASYDVRGDLPGQVSVTVYHGHITGLGGLDHRSTVYMSPADAERLADALVSEAARARTK